MSGQTTGRFLALEGIDGSGKSTQLQLLLERLRARGVECRGTREPSDGPVGAMIRQILTGRVTADNRVIAGLFAADRLDHLVNRRDGILEQVRSGVTVVTDRYYFSSYAYHSVDVDMDWVIQANALSAQLLRPTLTIFLDVPVETALERIHQNRFVEEIFDQEDRLRQTRELYFRAFERLKDVENVAVVDGVGAPEQVAQRVWTAAAPYFK